MGKELTGYKLKTGEDILEGDVVNVNSLVTFYVVKADGTNKFAYAKDWVLWGIEKSVQWSLEEDTHVWKRLGNIHDNPELLTHILGIPKNKI